ncbi:GNAT family N-acetyltransferase [Bacillus lacus]|uniref:GNAT family N-acetyltransferase n=1 Tax=Metabacillus lacus TaxID=1983721 RepID=A0A7X2J245_9BACI|nr:GNAT family N-acetyltransferase [Metabacillus lacus]MRX73931.1 GNAT family N-acetyltransferase [Metabacillus lacus]
MDNVIIMPYHPKYAEQTVAMWRKSKEEAIGQEDIHSFENHVHFLKEILVEKYKIELALMNEEVVGIIVYHVSEINQLYIHVDYQGMGIGNRLLAIAKERSKGKLSLYTFQKNKKAQRFYEKQGFKIVSKGHQNEEKLPDFKYEWISQD